MNPLITYNAQGVEVKTGDVVHLRGMRMFFTGVGLDGRLGFTTMDERKLFVTITPDTINWTTEEDK